MKLQEIMRNTYLHLSLLDVILHALGLVDIQASTCQACIFLYPFCPAENHLEVVLSEIKKQKMV